MLYFDSLVTDLANIASLAAGAVPAADLQDTTGTTTGTTWSLFTQQGCYFLLRWIHFLAGITWIGVLYYFNFIQTPFFKGGAPKEVVGAMTTGLVPNALWWFRWGAMFTFLSGLGMIYMKGHLMGNPFDGAWMTKILTGSLMGTLMWFNVWFIIWPAQKVVIASATQVAGGGEAIADAAARGARAGMASRTNTLFSIPMLFFMGAATNLPAEPDNLMVYWIVSLVIILAIEINGLSAPGKPTQKPLTTVSGTIHFGILVSVLLYVLLEIL